MANRNESGSTGRENNSSNEMDQKNSGSQQNTGTGNPQDGSDWNNYRERELSSTQGGSQSKEDVEQAFDKKKSS